MVLEVAYLLQMVCKFDDGKEATFTVNSIAMFEKELLEQINSS